MLVTTRDKRIGGKLLKGRQPIMAQMMTPQEAEKLFRSRLGKHEIRGEADLPKLLEELDHLPLAITQAAAFVDENDASIEEYLQALGRTTP